MTVAEQISVILSCTGIINHPYNFDFKKHHQLCLSILKRFGFGQRVMETRIVIEVENMISGIQAKQGHPFDPRQLITSCVANVVINMLFGRRFDHSNSDFQRLISDVNGFVSDVSFEPSVFPLLRLLPYYRKRIASIIASHRRFKDFVVAKVEECYEVCGFMHFVAIDTVNHMGQ